jgi:gluconolactonase
VTKAVKVVATDFSMCNGLAFTEDGSVAYVFVPFHVLVMSEVSHSLISRSDTGSTAGQTRPSTMYVESHEHDLTRSRSPADYHARRYAFDVDPNSHAFTNRRVFAYADTGIPDGIQVDTEGNVYSGTGDGVNVSVMLSKALHFLASISVHPSGLLRSPRAVDPFVGGA